MRNLLCFILLIIIGCSDASIKEKELKLKEKELELRERELDKKESVISNSTKPDATSSNSSPDPEAVSQPLIQMNKNKFIYIILKAKQPNLLTVTNEQKHLTEANGYSSPLRNKFSYETIMETNYYSSEVIEVSDYTKDKQFKLMDKFEFQILGKMEEDDRSYEFDVDTKAGLDRQSHYNNKSYIDARKCFVFDTYEEASIHSRKDARSKFK